MIAMRIAIAGLILLTGLTIAAPAYSDDLPFGADALRQLSTQATAVVRSSQPSRQGSDSARADDPTRAKYAVFSVAVAEVLKGDLTVGASIRIAFPESLVIQDLDQLKDAILFLRPFTDVDTAQSNIPQNGTVYLVISGRYGAVDSAPPNRAEAIKQYLGSTSNDAIRSETVLSWTDRYIKDPDPFLQRSAVVELYHERGQARALDQLSTALKSDAVLPASKSIAIDALKENATAAAAQQLRDVAEDDKTHRTLRERAIKAVGAMPGGRNQLQQWSSSPDQVLSGTANSTIRNLQ
jgi:hypothetical protein